MPDPIVSIEPRPGQTPDSAGFIPLPRGGPEPDTQVGCLFIVAAVLLIVGLGLDVGFCINPAGKGDMWVVPLVGTVFAAVGGVLLWGGVRGMRGLKVPRTELAIEKRAVLRPGTTTRLRVRQPGPVVLKSLKVKLSCQRAFQRQVKPSSSATGEDSEILWEQVLLEVQSERVPRGGILERDIALALPADARPTGPALPDGSIRWRIEVWGEAGFLRATYHPFDIVLGGTDSGQRSPSEGRVSG